MTTTILGILLAVVSGYSIYLRSEGKTQEEKITSISAELSEVLNEKLNIEINSGLISGALTAFLKVTSKASVKKVNKELSEFVLSLDNKATGDSTKLTVDVIENEDGSYGLEQTEVIDEVEA